MSSSNHFSISSCFPRFSGSTFFRVQVFLGLDFSGFLIFFIFIYFFNFSRFFRVQVFRVQVLLEVAHAETEGVNINGKHVETEAININGKHMETQGINISKYLHGVVLNSDIINDH